MQARLEPSLCWMANNVRACVITLHTAKQEILFLLSTLISIHTFCQSRNILWEACLLELNLDFGSATSIVGRATMETLTNHGPHLSDVVALSSWATTPRGCKAYAETHYKKLHLALHCSRFSWHFHCEYCFEVRTSSLLIMSNFTLLQWITWWKTRTNVSLPFWSCKLALFSNPLALYNIYR